MATTVWSIRACRVEFVAASGLTDGEEKMQFLPDQGKLPSSFQSRFEKTTCDRGSQVPDDGSPSGCSSTRHDSSRSDDGRRQTGVRRVTRATIGVLFPSVRRTCA